MLKRVFSVTQCKKSAQYMLNYTGYLISARTEDYGILITLFETLGAREVYNNIFEYPEHIHLYIS